MTTLMGTTVHNRLAAEDFTSQLAAHTDRFAQRFQEEKVSPDGEGLRHWLRDRLLTQSLLLKFPLTDRIAKGKVFEAYLHDGAIIPAAARELDRIIQGAAHAGIKVDPRNLNAIEWNARVRRVQQWLGETVYAKPWKPNYTLDAQTAGQYETVALLQMLQRQYQATVNHFLPSFLTHLEASTRTKVFGWLEWTSAERDVCWYGYFRHGVRKETRKVSQREERVPGWEQTVTTTTGADVFWREYHEHHLYEAEAHSVADYQVKKGAKIPWRVNAWLRTLPPWFSEQLTIVDGEIFLERIVRQDIKEEPFVEEKVIAKRRNYSPAVCLGPLVLVGWNGRDLKDDGPPPLPNEATDTQVQEAYEEVGLL